MSITEFVRWAAPLAAFSPLTAPKISLKRRARRGQFTSDEDHVTLTRCLYTKLSLRKLINVNKTFLSFGNINYEQQQPWRPERPASQNQRPEHRNALELCCVFHVDHLRCKWGDPLKLSFCLELENTPICLCFAIQRRHLEGDRRKSLSLSKAIKKKLTLNGWTCREIADFLHWPRFLLFPNLVYYITPASYRYRTYANTG